MSTVQSTGLAPEPGPKVEHPPTEALSLVTLLNVLLRHLRLLIVVPVVAVLLAVALWLVKGQDYVAASALKPQAVASNASRLAGLAAQFGISSIPGSESESPEFYAALLTSSDLLRATAQTEYVFATDESREDTTRGTLLDIYPLDEEMPAADQLRNAVDRLRGQVSAGSDLSSGLVRLRTRAEWPELAVQINRRMIDLLHEFNVARRQTQASAEREFIESRMAEAEAEYLDAESKLRAFLESNRAITASPQLMFEQNRLQRRVTLREQIYSSLAESYEQARIDEVRNTPVVTVVDRPEGSARKAPPGLLVLMAVAGVLGLLAGTALAALLESMQRSQAESPREFAEFERLRARGWRLLLAPLRRVQGKSKAS